MKKLLCCAVFFLFVLSDVKCPDHSYATCWDTGQVKIAKDGGMLYKYKCSCGDSWWVRKD